MNSNLEHIIGLLYRSDVYLKKIFAPEHGLYGFAQDQIGVSSTIHREHKIPVISLYGTTLDSLRPKPQMLDDLDLIIIDLQDIGARYYTFVWSASMILEVAAKTRTPVLVLDRPNPIGGIDIEGPVQIDEYRSFVGLYPLPIRHGMTIAEILCYVNENFEIHAELEMEKMSGWERSNQFENIGLHWVMPSPNMPHQGTAAVYPGMCFLEGTNLSEGRGTTRPFEIFGAPFIEPFRFIERLEKFGLAGVKFRALQFIPTFNKYVGELCGGIQIHIINHQVFRPVLMGFAIIKTAFELYPQQFSFKEPPYEYELEKLPFDLLTGNPKWRKLLISGANIEEITEDFDESCHKFERVRKQFLLY